jgi:integrase
MSQNAHVLIRQESRVPYFRKKIPDHLRASFGRREFICSLRTQEPSEVASRAAALEAKANELLAHARDRSVHGIIDNAELTRMFDLYRHGVCSGSIDVPPVEMADSSARTHIAPAAAPRSERKAKPGRYVFRPSMSGRLIGRHRAAVLAGDEIWRRTLMTGELGKSRVNLAAQEQALIDDIALNHLDNALPAALTLLEKERVDVSRVPLAAMLSFVGRYLREELDLVRIRIARLNGANIPTPEAPIGPLDEDEWVGIMTTWEAARLPKPASRYEATLALKRLRDVTGDKSPEDLTLADAMLFRSSLLAQLSRARAKSSLSLVRSIIKTAAAENRIPLTVSLAFESVKVEVSEKGIHSYQPFSIEQLQAFFNGPVHSEQVRPAKGGGDAAFWLPLLALYAGMRLEEAGSLACDSMNLRSGRLWLRIGRSKTASGLREVPVHTELVQLGLIDYVADRRRSGSVNEPLFPSLRIGSKENRTHMFSTWVNEYIDRHVVDDPAYVFHSFRNSFEEAATAGGVAEDVRRALMGHAQVAMTRRYGRKDARNRRVFPDRILIEAIDMLQYEGLSLSRVKHQQTAPIGPSIDETAFPT